MLQTFVLIQKMASSTKENAKRIFIVLYVYLYETIRLQAKEGLFVLEKKTKEVLQIKNGLRL